jgi:hypothetical protein
MFSLQLFLFDLILSMQTLTTLNLSCCKINDHGAQQLADILRNQTVTLFIDIYFIDVITFLA